MIDLAQLKVVRIGTIEDVLLDDLCAGIEQALTGSIDCIERADHEAPPVDVIEASLLTQALEFEIGGHILGVTDIDLRDGSGDDFYDFMFGGKDNRNYVAVVSVRRLTSRFPSRFFERVLKVALHELGHNLGLDHHYSFEEAPGGGSCPMCKGDFNGYGERGYVRAVIDSRGARFCSPCRRVCDSVIAANAA